MRRAMLLLRVLGLAAGAAALPAFALLLIWGPWNGSDSATDAGAAISAAAEPASGPIPTDPNLRVAFVGDTGEGSNFVATLNLIKNEGAELVLHQGDFDYVDDPDGFFNVINSVLGPTFPYLVSVGNHDAASWPDNCGDPDGCYGTIFKQRLTAMGITPDNPGLDDQMYSAVFDGLSMVFVGQDSNNTGDCPTQTNGYACYIRNRLSTDRHIWRVCSWHKNQQAMQVGGMSNEMGWNVYNNCINFGAFIATGHEHSYERSITMTNAQTQTVDLQQHPLASGIPTNPNLLRVKPGSSFAFVSGLGGESARPQTRCLPATYPYGCNHEWGSIYSLTQTNNVPRYGVLFIDFYVDGDPYKARAYFKTTGGQIIDSFDIHADFQDAEGDGIQDGIDNCPNWANPTQALPLWPVPAGDSDCDGFTDAQEMFSGTVANVQCAATASANDEGGADFWPVDFDDNQRVSILDVSYFASTFGAQSPSVQYVKRQDFNGDNRINILDVSYFSTTYAKRCGE